MLKKREIKFDIRIVEFCFDLSVVLQSFGLDENILESLYQTLILSVKDRITMKEK